MKVVSQTKTALIAKTALSVAVTVAAILLTPSSAFARDVEYKQGQGEIEVWVNPGEPTELILPGNIAGGYKNSNAGLAITHKEQSLIIFGKENINDNGEALLVRLQDGRSYPVRVRRASDENPRDAQVAVGDGKGPMGDTEEDEGFAPYKEKGFAYAPASRVSGLMREMVLVAEFGKKAIPGYTVSEKFKGQTVVDDGAVLSKIDKIFIGPNLWGYVLDTTNLLDQSQKLNPATFRLDGTRAVSASNWELAARPINVEEQIANKHNSKIYIVTRSR